MKRLLLLEDDISLVDGLAYSLKKEGYELDVARTVREAEAALSGTCNDYDLLLLDVSLPDGSGYEICEQIRASGNQVPILFLTAADEELNIIRGLDCGGDDYLTKPFRLGELCSRIRALIRRSGIRKTPENTEILSSGNLRIHLAENRVWLEEQLLLLTPMEYRLLCLFLRNKGRILTREMILNELWDSGGSFVDDNTLSVHIRRLREKIEEHPSRPVRLLTVRGFGYQWKEETS
ncbi:MAG: response regulator transcription factor [Lachnospiraceae bacterium]|nr:response regulator transcription factor [Lachnospiraceae bacterium]